jgi:hypothetical protein
MVSSLFWLARVESNHGSAPRHWLRTEIRLRRTAAHAVRAPLFLTARHCRSLVRFHSKKPACAGYCWLARVESNHRPLPCQGVTPGFFSIGRTRVNAEIRVA